LSDEPELKAAGRTALAPYWDRVARTHAALDPLGAVCYPAAPRWLNDFFARLQVRAVLQMLGAEDLRGKRCLDVGCGSGRWSRWLAGQGADVVGIDPTEAMLATARTLSPGLDLRRMSATAIDLPPESFDLVMAVTVIQHLRPEEQAEAARAMCRVLRPGGTLFVLDLIDLHDGGHVVFPRPPQDWISLYASQGLALERFEGQEFIALLRPLVRLLPSRRTDSSSVDSVQAPSLLERLGRYPAAFWPLWPLVRATEALEPLCQRFLPAAWGRHGCFLFRKPISSPWGG
jgi:2-polyprenyl-3-methyl-5-hydroxy-6-metoxy-1,4-benzoquinol methylase